MSSTPHPQTYLSLLLLWLLALQLLLHLHFYGAIFLSLTVCSQPIMLRWQHYTTNQLWLCHHFTALERGLGTHLQKAPPVPGQYENSLLSSTLGWKNSASVGMYLKYLWRSRLNTEGQQHPVSQFWLCLTLTLVSFQCWNQKRTGKQRGTSHCCCEVPISSSCFNINTINIK